jgi:hypothetical protein
MKNDQICVGLVGASPDLGWAMDVQAQALKGCL